MRKLLPILLLIVSVGLFYLHIDPRYKQIKETQNQVKEYKEAIEKASDLQKVRDELLTKYNALPKEEITRLEKMIPANLNTVKLITDLSAIGGPYGIAIYSVGVRDVADAGEDITALSKKLYETTSITFKFSASYPNLASFIRDIEKSLQLVDVKSLTFDVKDEVSGINNYEMTIQTYWLR